MAIGHNRDIEIGQNVKYQIEKYMHYRFHSAFLQRIGGPMIHVDAAYIPENDYFKVRLTVRNHMSHAEAHRQEMEYASSLAISKQALVEADRSHDRHEWLMYHCQSIMPMVDTGMFSCWFAASLPGKLIHEYNGRILPNLERVKLLPYDSNRGYVDQDSLAVVYLKRGGEWRETIHNIEEDPEAFLANLYMLVP